MFWLRIKKTIKSLNFKQNISVRFVFLQDSSRNEHKLLVASHIHRVRFTLSIFLYIYFQMLLMIQNPDVWMWFEIIYYTFSISSQSLHDWIADVEKFTWKEKKRMKQIHRVIDTTTVTKSNVNQANARNFVIIFQCLVLYKHVLSGTNGRAENTMQNRNERKYINKSMLSSCCSLVCQYFAFVV